MDHDVVQIILEAMPARPTFSIEYGNLVSRMPSMRTLRSEAEHVRNAIEAAGYEIKKRDDAT
jgi:hypothetical protein